MTFLRLRVCEPTEHECGNSNETLIGGGDGRDLTRARISLIASKHMASAYGACSLIRREMLTAEPGIHIWPVRMLGVCGDNTRRVDDERRTQATFYGDWLRRLILVDDRRSGTIGQTPSFE